jgi:Flp pilus assembly pilin Flp
MLPWQSDDDDDGATLVEYAFMIGFVAMVAFLAVGMFGGSVRGLFQAAADLMP